MLITWSGGPSSWDGMWAGYRRLVSDQRATPPYTFTGLVRVNDVMYPPVFEVGWRAGQTATYTPKLNFHPMLTSGDHNIVCGPCAPPNPLVVGISAELRSERPSRPYGVRTGYDYRYRRDLPANPVGDGRFHEFRWEVYSPDHYAMYWDGLLVAEVRETLPATMGDGEQAVGLRLDFLAVDLGPMYLEEHAVKLTDLADVCRSAGLTVVEENGRDKDTGRTISWREFGRSGNSGYSPPRPTHVMVHHTASRTTIANDVRYANVTSSIRPLTNIMLARNGAVHVCAAGPTNTNGSGSSAPWGSPVPLNSMNVYAIGIEVCNNGIGEPYPRPQQEALMTLVVTLCRSYGIPADHVRAHFEWAPTRKVDPSGPSRWSYEQNRKWDMGAFRSEVAAWLAWVGDPEEEDMAYIAKPPPEHTGKEWLYVSSSVRPATSFDVDDGVPVRDMASINPAWRADQYAALRKAAGL